MKIWYAPYILEPLKSLNSGSTSKKRKGFLIKIQNKEMKAGYADVHPWAQFGDEKLKVLLSYLKEKKVTPLLERSLFFAMADGWAREEKKSLFNSKIQVKSHFTVTDVRDLKPKLLEKIRAQGFTTIKVKAGRKPKGEAKKLSQLSEKWLTSFAWRLDFNGQGGGAFLKKASPDFLKHIDLIEDPEAYNLKDWQKLSKKFKVQLACDQDPTHCESHPGPRVIKPARQSVLARAEDIVTNSMDHPVGQSFAFWQAQASIQNLGKQTRDYGLKTQHLFKTNDFFKEIESPTPFFKYSDGDGVGFNELLKKQDWRLL